MSNSKGAPQPSQTGPSRNWMRLQAAAVSPPACAAPPSMACGGKIRSSAPRQSPRTRGPGFSAAPSLKRFGPSLKSFGPSLKSFWKRPSSALMPPPPSYSPPSSGPPRLFDRVLHRKRLDRAAGGFAAADFLQRRAALDIAERLEGIMRDFPLAVDLSARNGTMRQVLTESTVARRIGLLIEADLSPAMLAGRAGPRVLLDEERLPFAAESLDLVVSTLGLHWTNDVVGALIQICQALKPDGLFIGALLGGSTLTELRQALTAAEDEILGGAGSRVSPFADSRDAAGLLQRAGFALPVVDVDRVNVSYEHPLKLLADLRQMGETNVLADRHPRALTRTLRARASEIYVQRFGAADGRVAATFEIVTLTGWSPHESQQQPLAPGSAKMRLADALGVVEHHVPRDD